MSHSKRAHADLRANLVGLQDRVASQSMAAGLYLVATPIGNLADITVRATHVLACADALYCEDTRITRRLLHALGLQRPLRTYHEHNAAAKRDEILDLIADGGTVALVSDAGTPLISDPGYKLVHAVRDAGHAVVPIPGPSALTAVLSAAGLPTDTVTFLGFLPTKSAARRTRLGQFKGIATTLVFYESPHRLPASLADARDTLGPLDAVVGRELTKRFEELRGGDLAALAEWAAETDIKGEIAVVIAQPEPGASAEITDDEIIARAQPMLANAKRSSVARNVARDLGVSKSRVYDLLVTLTPDP